MNWRRLLDQARSLIVPVWLLGVPVVCVSVGGMDWGVSLFLTLVGGFALLCLATAVAWIFGELSLLARLGRGRPEPKKIWVGRITTVKTSVKIALLWAIVLSAALQLNVWVVATLDDLFPRHYFGNINNPRIPSAETPNWLFFPILIIIVWVMAAAGAKLLPDDEKSP